jgi:hypothetical protein
MEIFDLNLKGRNCLEGKTQMEEKINMYLKRN